MLNAYITSKSSSERVLPAFSVFCSIMFFFLSIDITVRDDFLGSFVLSHHNPALDQVMFAMQTCLGIFSGAFRFSICFHFRPLFWLSSRVMQDTHLTMLRRLRLHCMTTQKRSYLLIGDIIGRRNCIFG
jgi:hypothetical protein